MYGLLICLILDGLCYLHVNSAAVFMGGTMTYEVIHYQNHIVRAKITALQGWKLGTGPCGAHCTSASIGIVTRATRAVLTQMYGDDYFGTWLLEVPRGSTHYYDNITQNVTDEMHETVADVNEIKGLELDRVEFTLDLPKMDSYIDVIFEGSQWRKTSLQPSVKSFHLQISIDAPYIRNDTGDFDRVPIILMKPFYRLIVNKTYKMEDFICVKDDDGDFLSSRPAVFEESGIQLSSSNFPRLKGSSNGALISTVSLLPNNTGIVGLKINSERFSDKYFQSKNQVQFVVEIVSEDQSPVFVSTKNQQYFLYNGVSLNTTFTAMSPVPSRNISRIITTLDGKSFTSSSKLTFSSSQASLYIVWSPTDNTNHVMCVTAEDDTGLKSSLMNCVNIFSKHFQTSGLTEGKILSSNSRLNFTNFPVFGSIICEVDRICRFPVSVTSKDAGSVLDIQIKSSNSSSAKIASRLKPTSPHTKSVDVELRDRNNGLKSICFEARTVDSITEQCVHVIVNEKNPCKPNPCKNLGTCVPLLYNKDFTCQCTTVTEGRYCEKYVDLCSSSPCQQNGTCHQYERYMYCICPAGRTGDFCEQSVAPCEDISVRDCQDAKALQYICPDPASAKYCRKSCKLCHFENPSNIFG